MKIAVDFDGTIVEHRYPKIGKEIPFAIETLKKLQQDKHQIILWTVREDDLLQEAVDFCKQRGLVFYAVNLCDPEENIYDPNHGRKLNVDMFIDDKNVGGLLDWGIIYRIISDGISFEELYREEKKKRSWLDFFMR